MRLITTCPACEATFYVSPEQLSAHRGDVRCGKCNHIFNALDALNQLDQNKTPEVNKTEVNKTSEVSKTSEVDKPHIAAEETALVEPAASQTQAEELVTQTEAVTQAEDVLEHAPKTETLNSINEAEVEDEAQPEPESNTEQSDAAVEVVEAASNTLPVEQADVESVTHELAAEQLPEPQREPEPEPQPEPESQPELEKPKASVKPSLVEPIATKSGAQVAPSPTPTFSLDVLNGAEKTATKTKSRLFVWLLALLALVLLLAACLQTAYFLRTEIAAKWPITKPYLTMACQQIGCKVELSKHAEFIIVEDSDLQEDATHTGVINLSTTLINNAKFIQAYPLLELTLTDTLEKPKLRRTFTPQEYLAKDVDADKGIAPGGEVEIKLTLTTNGEAVAGYRVFVRY